MHPFFSLFVNTGIVKFKRGKSRIYISTNDLNSSMKLDVEYIQNRERRKKGEID